MPWLKANPCSLEYARYVQWGFSSLRAKSGPCLPTYLTPCDASITSRVGLRVYGAHAERFDGALLSQHSEARGWGWGGEQRSPTALGFTPCDAL